MNLKPYGLGIVLVGLLTLVGVGFGVGLRQGGERVAQEAPISLSSPIKSTKTGDAAPARSYLELLENPWRPVEASWGGEAHRSLSRTRPAEGLVSPRNVKARQTALKARERLRAFSGAPPTIPHAVSVSSDQACRACHEQGLQTAEAGRPAPPYSHVLLVNCTQCHVTSQSELPGTTVAGGVTGSVADSDRSAARRASNTFSGLTANQDPYRWANAPPVMPHGRFMRGRCLACHGPLGAPGLQTTHPERVACVQCHLSGTSLQQGPTH